ncbi:MAG TPA: chemotaxis protein CheA [Hyphomicrobium sp.]|nr:chemotaxis protein CheA [Hyphomicrobium sp.]
MDEELLEQFLIEGRELVAQASDDLLALERSPSDAARLDSLFRAVHTLKGSVALFDLEPMSAVLHAAEDLLGSFRSKQTQIDRAAIDALLGCIDASGRWIEAIAQTGQLPPSAEREGRSLSRMLSADFAGAGEPDEGAPTAPDEAPVAASASAESGARTVRVDAARIDALVDLVGELIVAKNSLAHLAAQASDAESPFAGALAANASGVERLANDINRAVMALRMTPLSRIFGRFPRWMRDTASKLDKPIDFQIRDGGVEADKSIVDGLFEPLLHILRNAVDHGIEPAQIRRQSGKPLSGRITLEARPEGDQIVISVSDDGAGLDPSRLRAAAKRKNLLSPAIIDSLDDAAAAELIFLPGFSSSETVTDMSGRGVGMDAVRTAIAGLGGRVSVTSTLGAGTTVQMLLPQAVLSTTVILTQAGEELFGVPIGVIAETARIAREGIVPIRDGQAFVLRDRTLPLLALSDLLRLPQSGRTGAEARILVVSAGDQRVGIEVDAFGERLDIVLRPLTGLLSGTPGIMGTALLGDGRVLLVLDLPALIG